MEKVMLNNGVTMPVLGFGVFQIPDAKECERCVLDAIEVGYRSIDTAQIYGNEEAVGRAAEKSGVPREELFLTTKVWISNGGYEKAKASIDESLRKLRTDYLDVYLIHNIQKKDWPGIQQMDVSKFYHGGYYLEELKTIEGKRFGDRGKHQFK